MRRFLAILCTALSCLGADPFFDQQAALMSQFQPGYVGGLQGDWGAYDPGFVTLNGTGISALKDRSGLGHDLLQATANNQPLISRADNAGNLLVSSEEFQTTWSKTRINAFGVTDTGATGAGSFANTTRTLDPAGGNNADFVQEDGTAASTHFSGQLQPVASPSGSYKLSVSAKPSGRNWIFLQASGGTGSSQGYFDVQNGVVGGVSGSGNYSAYSGSIVAKANGFYECTLLFTCSAATAFSCNLVVATANGTASYGGDNTSGLFLWGASLRQASWSDTYVPTTATIAVPGLNGQATAYFDGVDDFLKTAAFTLNQPTFVVMAAKQVNWTDQDYVFDGVSGPTTMTLYQRTITPRLRMATTTGGGGNQDGLSLGLYGVISCGFDGANSFSRLGRAVAVTASLGSSSGGGFTLGSSATPTGYSNIQVARVLVFNRIPSQAEQDYLVTGLAAQFGIAP